MTLKTSADDYQHTTLKDLFLHSNYVKFEGILQPPAIEDYWAYGAINRTTAKDCQPAGKPELHHWIGFFLNHPGTRSKILKKTKNSVAITQTKVSEQQKS